MKRSALLSALAIAAAAACSDDLERTAVPTEPTGPAMSVETGAPASVPKSTICRSFTAERERAKRQLEQRTGDAALEKELRSLDKVVADVCE